MNPSSEGAAGERVLRLMPDDGCSPLWEPGGDPYNVSPDALLLPDELQARLWAWAARVGATLNPDDPVTSGFPGPAEHAAFVQDGQVLAALQAAPGPHVRIQYDPPEP